MVEAERATIAAGLVVVEREIVRLTVKVSAASLPTA